ncbi:MAG: glycosyltransferase family 25 protein [Opitutaceae bacterium]
MDKLKSDSFWSHVEGSLVINLDEREDRWAEAKKVLESFIPPGKFDRLSAVNGKQIKGYGEKPWFRARKKDFRWAGRAGCTLSHRKALEEGLRQGWEVFLVLEDDICLRQVPEDYLERLNTLIFDQVTDWDICYLGFTSPRGPAKTLAEINDDSILCKIRGARTTHAYLVKAPLAKWLLEKLPREENIWSWCAGRRIIDRWYSRHISSRFNVICTSPSFIIQAPSFSDLVGREADNWDESEMVSDIPDTMRDPNQFQLRWLFSGLQCRLFHAYDIARGWVKHLRGF